MGEHPDPFPSPGEVVISVRHAGISFADTLTIQNKHQNPHPLPFVPGMEVAGEVAVVGDGVDRFSPGDRVAALVYDGGCGELVSTKATECFPLPDAVSTEVGASMLSVYLTSYLALIEEGELAPKESLLVLGAAGGTGLAAVDIARAHGARVVAAASSQAKLEVAASRGAEQGIDYSKEDLRVRVKEITDGEGVDVVFDPVGGAQWEAAFRSLAWGGRHLIVGFAGGEIPTFKGNLLLVKNRSARGFALMFYRRFQTDTLARAAADLFAMVADGRIEPLVTEVATLEDAPVLFRRIMDREAVGKAAVAVR